MIIDLMRVKTKRTKDDALLAELDRLSRELALAQAEFNNSLNPLEIEAAVYRMKELETRQRIIYTKAKLESMEG
ncbi:MAG: hypothetical protein ACI4RB_03035 [Acutalibacteraceae bacterium]